MKNSLMILFLCSCGMKIKGLENLESLENIEAKGEIKTDLPDSIAFEPDFENAMLQCDIRYGVGTESSEDCFKDFRDYYKTTIGFDFSGIIEFCEQRYELEADQNECLDELVDIVGNTELQNV